MSQLRPRDAITLLDALMYRATPEDRRILINEHPGAYARYCNSQGYRTEPMTITVTIDKTT